ncbi:MAG: hypothetical protein Q8R13_06270 [bacterium]|nr:hypothetical protein [bacterium]
MQERIWGEVSVSRAEVQIYSNEPWKDSFVYHATASAARKVVSGSVFERWLGNTHVSICGSTTPAQLRRIHKLVFAEVTARRRHIRQIKAILDGQEPAGETEIWRKLKIGEETEPRKLWKVKEDGFQGLELQAIEPFGDSFVYHATERAAHEVYPGGFAPVHAHHMGYVSIPRSVDTEKARQIRERVEQEVETRAAHLAAVKAELEMPCYDGQPLLRAEINGFHGIELHPVSEPLRGRTPQNERHHGICPQEDYFVFTNTERIAKQVFTYGVHHNWATHRGMNIEIPRACTIEQAGQIRSCLSATVEARAAVLDEIAHQGEIEEAQVAERQALVNALKIVETHKQEIDTALAAYQAARARLIQLGVELEE